jgi:hypothetical protein
MVSIKSLFLAASAVVSTFAAPTELAIRSPGELAERQSITTSQTGTNNGYYYSFCKSVPHTDPSLASRPQLLLSFPHHWTSPPTQTQGKTEAEE